MSHESFSVSGTSGTDTSFTVGVRSVPVTDTPASTAWFLRIASALMPGLSIGPENVRMPRSTVRRCPNAV